MVSLVITTFAGYTLYYNQDDMHSNTILTKMCPQDEDTYMDLEAPLVLPGSSCFIAKYPSILVSCYILHISPLTIQPQTVLL